MKICEHKLTKLVGEHTIVEWFEWAKDNGYEWAQSALDQTPIRNLNFYRSSLSLALYVSFTWVYSNEGYLYWKRIYNKLRNDNL